MNPAWVQDKILSQRAYVTWNSDIDRESRHFKAINFLAARGVFVSEAFEPEKPLTREEALTVLDRLLALENCPRGMEKSSLSREGEAPAEPCTRGQFAQWLVEAKQKVDPGGWRLVSPPWPSYSDVPPHSPHFAAIETLKARRISGMLFENAEPGLFTPDAPITRADAAEAIYLAHRAYAMGYWIPSTRSRTSSTR